MDKARIVVVDDDQDVLASVRAILESRDYEVMTANDRQTGMALISKMHPDLAILDVMMDTWSDGFEMSRELRNAPALKDLRILMLTGVKNKTGIEFKSTAGDPVWLPVDGYLEKPITPQRLLEQVQTLLQC